MIGFGMIINPYILGGASVSYLVDDYSPTVAYSLRKLSSTATKSIRVRRSSDNAEQDIGFVGVDLDTASLLSFVGAGNGFVTKLYNQGVGSIPQPTANWNASNSSASTQWQIVSSGSLITEGSKPAFQFNNASHTWYTIDNSLTLSMLTGFAVAKVDTQKTINYLMAAAGAGTFMNGSFAGVDGIGAFDGSNVRTMTGEDLNRHLAYWNMRSSKLYTAKDGGAEVDTGAFATSLGITNIGGRAAESVSFWGKVQEVIMFVNNQSSNKAAIESNINTYYGIY